MAALSGMLTKRLVETLPPGSHGDGPGLYLVVERSGARHRIVGVSVKGQKNRKDASLRRDFGAGGADVVTLNTARERALECRRTVGKRRLSARLERLPEARWSGVGHVRRDRAARCH